MSGSETRRFDFQDRSQVRLCLFCPAGLMQQLAKSSVILGSVGALRPRGLLEHCEGLLEERASGLIETEILISSTHGRQQCGPGVGLPLQVTPESCCTGVQELAHGDLLRWLLSRIGSGEELGKEMGDTLGPVSFSGDSFGTKSKQKAAKVATARRLRWMNFRAR